MYPRIPSRVQTSVCLCVCVCVSACTPCVCVCVCMYVHIKLRLASLVVFGIHVSTSCVQSSSVLSLASHTEV